MKPYRERQKRILYPPGRVARKQEALPRVFQPEDGGGVVRIRITLPFRRGKEHLEISSRFPSGEFFISALQMLD